MKIGYARVSTKDQCLDLQLNALKQYGCDVIYSDFGVSGAKKSRPEFDKCISSLKKGDSLVVWKFDRVGRTALHLTGLIHELLARGIFFVSITQGFDTGTSTGKLVSTIMAGVAEYERDVCIERIVAGMEAAKESGKRISRPRLYDDRIDEVLEYYEDGRTTRQIEELTGISRSTVARICKLSQKLIPVV